MSLILYNTLTKKEELFTPLNPDEVTMYTCGPTVYGRPHIGNYSSFLMADLLRRWLEVSGYTVKHAKNITDVGHLAGDDSADADGEDKIERQAARENIDPLEIARKYTEQYLEDEKALNLLEPFARPKATEVISEMLEMIRTLVDKGHAYETDDGFYFAVESFPEYGKLSGNTLDQLSAGARIEVDEKKKSPHDFALWKKCVGDNAHHLLRWDTATGERLNGTDEDPTAGFPGWHIECSVMSSMILGESIDIHTGGEDLIFPHHECEIAQSECCYGKQFVQVWLHKRFIDVGDTKMSKSLGNGFEIPDIVSQGFHPLDIRYLFLSVHYRTNLKFTDKGLDDARKARKRIMEWMEWIRAEDGAGAGDDSMPAFIDQFTEAMNNDLNTPGALAVVFEAMNWSRAQKALTGPQKEILISFIEKVDHTFGCFISEDTDIPAEVQTLVDQRQQARDDKDFDASDRLRDEIAALGYEVRDGSGGQEVRKA